MLKPFLEDDNDDGDEENDEVNERREIINICVAGDGER